MPPAPAPLRRLVAQPSVSRLAFRSITASPPVGALPVRRPNARRRDPARILSVPRRPERAARAQQEEQGNEVLVEMPEDREGVLRSTHAARRLLEVPGLVVSRQIEMLNLFAGFEQANKYKLTSLDGTPVGFLAEEDAGVLGTVSRQALRTRRPFRAVVLDLEGKPILWIRRPLQWINSRIYVHSSEGASEMTTTLVGEAQQSWHLWRRKYDLFKTRVRASEAELDQFAQVDEGLWSWNFFVKDGAQRARGSVNRNFGGLGREIFTDTGSYVVRFDAIGDELSLLDSASPQPPSSTRLEATLKEKGGGVPELSDAKGLTLDERAVVLATAISIDFDYFSRHSGHGGMGFPMFFPFFGGGAGSEVSDAQPGEVPLEAQTPEGGQGVSLPEGMRTGSIAEELAREDNLERQGEVDERVGEEGGSVEEDEFARGGGRGGDGMVPDQLDWWERPSGLNGQEEGEELMGDPWADEGLDGSEGEGWP